MIIGLSGWARTGKDTVANYLVEKHDFVKLSFADPMRKALIALDPIITVSGVYTPLSQAVRLIGWEELKTLSPDIRPLMQRLGTEVGRNIFGQNIWVDLAMQEADNHKNVVFADCRFQNEAQAIKDANGSVWRIMRSGVKPANNHISENDLNAYIFDAYLSNSGDTKNLYKQVEEVMHSHYLLNFK
jgi:hypothetical protein